MFYKILKNIVVPIWFLVLYTPLIQAENPVVSLEANESQPFWSAKMSNDGMCGEIVHAISEHVGLNSVIKYKPLQRLINDDSNNDLGDPTFYISYQDFTAIIPIAISYISFFYYDPDHNKTISINTLSDLKDKRVGVLKGTLTEQLSFEKAGIIFEESYSQDSLFKKLKLGRIDVAIEIDLVGHQTIKKIFPNELEKFISIPVSETATPIAIMIAEYQQNGNAISTKYKNGLHKIINNGIYAHILEKYYGESEVPEDWY